MPAVRALFAEEDDARAVAGRLVAEGFAATVRRAPFAGEDDDEDHAWAVDTDAPAMMVELLAEDQDGWVEHEPDAALQPPPLQLPDAPRRHHRPVGGDS